MAIQKVVVVDGNNLIVRIDRGVAGRSVTDVVPVEIEMLFIWSFTSLMEQLRLLVLLARFSILEPRLLLSPDQRLA